jgi:hypothetical protein
MEAQSPGTYGIPMRDAVIVANVQTDLSAAQVNRAFDSVAQMSLTTRRAWLRFPTVASGVSTPADGSAEWGTGPSNWMVATRTGVGTYTVEALPTSILGPGIWANSVPNSQLEVVNFRWSFAYVDGMPFPVTMTTTRAGNVISVSITVMVAAASGLSISGAANNGSGLIRLTVSSTANLVTGYYVVVVDVTGTVEANNVWKVTVIDGTHIDLQGSTFANAYGGGGGVEYYRPVPVDLPVGTNVFVVGG